jgi:2-succinyl-6-hydroxy-2,4-cyclohexadiene-1-carboxylate synthase
MAATAAGLAALFDRVLGEPAHLLGYSMGGRLALYVALHYPDRVRSLLLESASPGLADAEARAARRQRDEALAARIERAGVPAFVDFWGSIPLFASQAKLPADARARLREQRLRNRAAGLANSLRGMGTGAQPSLWPRLGEVTAPTLLLVGEEDAKFRGIALEMARLLPRSQTMVFPGAGHTVHLERPRAFVRHILPWLTAS